MANNKNNALTEEEKRKRMVALDENRGSATRRQSVYIDSPENTWREVKKTRDQEEREKWLKEYASTPGGIPNGIISQNTAQTVTEPTTLKRYENKAASPVKSAVLAPDTDPDGISPDAVTGASPSTGDAVRRNEPSSPHGSYEEVGADYAANAPYGGIRYADGFFVYKDGNGGYYTEAYGKKTPSDIYGNPLTAPTTQKEQSAGAASDGKETISQAPTVDYDHYYDYAPAGTGASDENTRRTLDEIYQEYLNSQYYQNAIAEGKRLAEDVLGKYAGMTGGMPSTAATYAATAAGQQSDRNAQNYLWELAQKQYRNEQEDANAETEKYSAMIDNFLKMGYGINEIPDEWWAKAEYDPKYASGLADYMKKMNDTSAAEADSEREVYSSLLGKYIAEGRYNEIPDDLFTRAGYTEEQAAAMKNYYAGSGAAQTTDAKAGKPYSEWKTEDFESADKYTESALKKYKNGNDWEGYIATLDRSVGEYVYEYLANHAPMKLREWKLDKGTYIDEFGNEYGKDALISALVSEGMKEADAKTFVKNIKA